MRVPAVLFCFLFSLQSGFSQSEESSVRSLLSGSSMGMMAISVTVGGSVPFAGSYPASPTERVDQLFTRLVATVITSNRNLEEWEKADMLRRIPQRNITIRRADGSSLTIDLLRYRLNGDLSLNPYLKNDDVIIFPPWQEDRQIVTIYGAVNQTVRLQFVEGDRVSDVLFFARGTDPSYEQVERIEISRLNNGGQSEQLISLRPGDDVPVQIGDRIRVVAADSYRRDFKVLVLGEVNNPGFINITRNSTTLKQVFEKAGGLKPDASLKYAKLFSSSTVTGQLTKAVQENRIQTEGQYLSPIYKYLDVEPKLNLMEMARMSSLTTEDTVTFEIDNQLRLMQPGDLADLSELIDPNSVTSQTIVQDGDLIIIPRKPKTVYVFGQVNRIGNIPFIEGKDYNYYLSQAGGLGEESTGDVYVIKGKSRAWQKIGETGVIIEAGDYIWAAKEIKRPFAYYLTVAGGVASVIGSIATVLLLIVQLGK